jgi:hypothetical protein
MKNFLSMLQNHLASQEQISAAPKKEKPKEDQGEYLSYSTYNPAFEVKIPLSLGQDVSLPKELKERLIKEVDLDCFEGYLSFFGLNTLCKAVKRFSFPKFYVLLQQNRQSNIICFAIL